MSDGSVIIDSNLNTNGVEKGISKLKGSFSKIGNVAKTALQGTAVAVGAVTSALIAGVTAGTKYNATIEQYTTSFEVMTGSAEKATEVVEKLKKLGAETPFEMTDLAETTQLLMNYGLTADDAISKMQMLGDISQGSADKMNRIAMAYGQMSSAGKVSLEDIKQMIEAGFNPLQEISKTTGESMASLYDRISKGTISIDEITASMGRSTSAGGKYFQSMEKQSQTINGQLSTLKDNASQLLGTLSEGLSSTLSGEILPLLNETVSSLQQAFETEGIEGFAEKLGEVLGNLSLKISEAMPQIVDIGVKIVQSLITGIQNNLPQIIQSGITVIQTLLQAFFEMLPQILQMGITMLTELIKGIAQMLPELIPMAINCIITLVETLLDNIDMIIDAGIELIIALIEGIFNALPDLIARLPELIVKIATKLIELIVVKIPQVAVKLVQSLIEGLFSYWNKMLSKIKEFFKGTIFEGLINKVTDMAKAGLELVQGLWNGIKNAASWLWNKVSGWCNDLLNNIKSFFGIHSPSKVFEDEIGVMLGEGIGKGFDESLDTVYKEMRKAVEHENAKMTADLTNSQQIKVQNEDNRQATLQSIDDNKEIVVNNTTRLDSKVIARETNKVNARMKLQYSY